MDKIRKVYEVSSDRIELGKLSHDQFLKIKIWAISTVYPNRNDTHFTPESLRVSKDTVYGKPILGYFDKYQGDLHAHDGNWAEDEDGITYWNNAEIPLGFVRPNDEVEIVEKDGVEWLVVTAVLWTQYSWKAIKKIFKDKNKKVSVEVDQTKYYVDEKGITVIDKFDLIGITILGSKVVEGIPNAHLSLIDKLDRDIFSKKKEKLCFAYQELEKNDANADNLSQNNQEGENSKMDAEQLKKVIKDDAIDECEDCESLRMKCHELMERCNGFEDCQKELEDCKAQLAERENECNMAKANLEERENECNMCKETLAAKDQEINECKESLTAKEAEFDTCKAELDACKAEFDAYKADSEEKEKTYTADKENFEAMEKEKDQKIEELNANFAELQNHCAELEQKGEAMANELEEAKKIIEVYTIETRTREAQELFAKGNLTEEEQNSILEKCAKGEYANKDQIETEVALMSFRKQQAKVVTGTTTYSAPLNNVIVHENVVKSIADKVREYVGK